MRLDHTAVLALFVFPMAGCFAAGDGQVGGPLEPQSDVASADTAADATPRDDVADSHDTVGAPDVAGSEDAPPLPEPLIVDPCGPDFDVSFACGNPSYGESVDCPVDGYSCQLADFESPYSIDGYCMPELLPPGACFKRSQCETGERCLAASVPDGRPGRCVPAQEPGECWQQADCPAGFSCVGASSCALCGSCDEADSMGRCVVEDGDPVALWWPYSGNWSLNVHWFNWRDDTIEVSSCFRVVLGEVNNPLECVDEWSSLGPEEALFVDHLETALLIPVDGPELAPGTLVGTYRTSDGTVHTIEADFLARSPLY